MKHEIVPLKRIGYFKGGDQYSFSIQRKCWSHNFDDGLFAIGEKHVKKNRLYTAGCYCFWWIGNSELLKRYNATHYIKGKQTNLLDRRIRTANTKVVRVDLKKDGSPRAKPTHHLYHPIDWSFKEATIGNKIYVPLYVGKSSHIFDRITSHLKWTTDVEMSEQVPVARFSEDNEVSYQEEILRTVRKPPNNTVAQFRAGFKFLREQAVGDLPSITIDENIGLSIYKTEFDSVEKRFYMEGELIDDLRPPFNVDSER